MFARKKGGYSPPPYGAYSFLGLEASVDLGLCPKPRQRGVAPLDSPPGSKPPGGEFRGAKPLWRDDFL